MTLKANLSAMRETARDTRRDTGFVAEHAAIDPATGRAVVIVRIYQPGTVAYCSLWIHGRTGHGRGQGQAGGGGYHKASAAMAAAIEDAGIVLTGDVYGRDKGKSRTVAHIGGVGESAMIAALEAIARAATGKRRLIIHSAHA
jgi:hypothetical protein